ncbi:hypothetical protein LCGC14_2309550 [marine sediment metagenome]|uniref:Uncharacterized protein n=1 Tax=marine sediment metagenome TaxID=412755 RepID=A0A0F9CLJ7_9ZZZZ
MARPPNAITSDDATPPQLIEGFKPPTVLTPPNLIQGEEVKTVAPTCVPDLAIGYRILREMRRVTPKGAMRPWRTPENVGPILGVLAAGEDEGSLLDHVRGAAELVDRGEQDPQWWYPANLFGGTTGPRWAADVAALRLSQARLARAEAEALALEARLSDEAQEAAQAPLVTNIEIQRMARDFLVSKGVARPESDDGAEIA